MSLELVCSKGPSFPGKPGQSDVAPPPHPTPPTPSLPSRKYFALISNFVVERV
jgi:hypothetical protein